MTPSLEGRGGRCGGWLLGTARITKWPRDKEQDVEQKRMEIVEGEGIKRGR